MRNGPDFSRREFLKASIAAVGWGALGPGAPARAAGPGPIPRRMLGKTGIEASILGFGAFPIGALGNARQAREVIDRVLDLGVNYLDTAPSYSDGTSESRIGEAIRGRREKLILATKSVQRRKADALRDLDGSLKRLGTDHVDIWQIHSVQDHEDLDRILAEDGPVRAGEEARKAGKIRFLGVTGHVHPEANLRALEEYDFATILMPLNVADPHHLSFAKDVLPLAVKRQVGVIAMKVLAAGRLPGKYGLSAADCLRYAMSLPVSCAIVGLDSIEQADAAAEAARHPPLGEEELAALVARVDGHPGRSLEWYKNEIAPRRSPGPKRD